MQSLNLAGPSASNKALITGTDATGSNSNLPRPIADSRSAQNYAAAAAGTIQTDSAFKSQTSNVQAEASNFEAPRPFG